jgi:hypothetical protein
MVFAALAQKNIICKSLLVGFFHVLHKQWKTFISFSNIMVGKSNRYQTIFFPPLSNSGGGQRYTRKSLISLKCIIFMLKMIPLFSLPGSRGKTCKTTRVSPTTGRLFEAISCVSVDTRFYSCISI